MAPRIEALLSARLFLSPQVVGDQLYFVSNMGGQLNLYALNRKGGIPQPLLPPNIALQNPELIAGYLYYVFPKLGKILIMLDNNGDELYEPMFVPIDGGFPEPVFGAELANRRVALTHCDAESGQVYFSAERRDAPITDAYRGDLNSGKLEKLAESTWGCFVVGVSDDHSHVLLADGYTAADTVLYLHDEKSDDNRTLLYGVPLQDREEGEDHPPSGIFACFFTPKNRGILLVTALFDDAYGLGYLSMGDDKVLSPVEISGIKHSGVGEMTNLDHIAGDRYLVSYNIDGVSWVYEGKFDEDKKTLAFDRVICGEGELANGTLEAIRYDKESDTYAIAFSTATQPTQLFTVKGDQQERYTDERVLGVPAGWLSDGEDASFTSHDGLRVSARLYLPAQELGYDGPRPLVYYVHGGPQGQERPNFAWFSMPLIQFLTLNGFAVFVPNARGSTGYGLSYMKHVDHDWGGADRLDHVHAMTKVLPNDPRIDVSKAGVIGRSYGGYMTLTLSMRHPELWAAAVDMFGPTDLIDFVNRVPETWKPYFYIAIGNPETDRDFLVERSPRTYSDQLAVPMLVIQGKNDPRVTEPESHNLVDHLREIGKQVDYIVFEDEGHDVLKFANKVRCYNGITDFFKANLI